MTKKTKDNNNLVQFLDKNGLKIFWDIVKPKIFIASSANTKLDNNLQVYKIAFTNNNFNLYNGVEFKVLFNMDMEDKNFYFSINNQMFPVNKKSNINLPFNKKMLGRIFSFIYLEHDNIKEFLLVGIDADMNTIYIE